MKDIEDIFGIGDEVNVTARPDDLFNHDFTGYVIGHRNGYVQVKDQDDDVWECDAEQLSHCSDKYFHGEI